jgi:hypothetical protein
MPVLCAFKCDIDANVLLDPLLELLRSSNAQFSRLRSANPRSPPLGNLSKVNDEKKKSMMTCVPVSVCVYAECFGLFKNAYLAPVVVL